MMTYQTPITSEEPKFDSEIKYIESLTQFYNFIRKQKWIESLTPILFEDDADKTGFSFKVGDSQFGVFVKKYSDKVIIEYNDGEDEKEIKYIDDIIKFVKTIKN